MGSQNASHAHPDVSHVLHLVLATLALRTHHFLFTDRSRELLLFVKENVIPASLPLLMEIVQPARLDVLNAQTRPFVPE